METVHDEIRLGEELLRSSLITKAQLRTAQEYQNSLGGRLEEIVQKLGFVEEKRLQAFLARRDDMRSVDLTGRQVDAEIMAQIPREAIERHAFVVIRESERNVWVATSQPPDDSVQALVQPLTKAPVEMVLASRAQIREQLDRYFAKNPAETEIRASAEELIRTIQDPAVAALARALVNKGLVDARSWQEAFGAAP